MSCSSYRYVLVLTLVFILQSSFLWAQLQQQTTSPLPSIFNIFRPQISISKFPPILEFIAQRIQAQFSNYIYEDLSRPSTYDRPTYKPYVPTTEKQSTPMIMSLEVNYEIIEETTTTEAPLQLSTETPPQVIFVDTYDLVSSMYFNSTIVMEYHIKKPNLDKHNKEKIRLLEKQVAYIMNEHRLKTNNTQIFAKQKCPQEIQGRNCNKYKDISSMFIEHNANNYQKQLIGDLIKLDCEDVIALTKIGTHVYLNTIGLKRLKDQEVEKSINGAT